MQNNERHFNNVLIKLQRRYSKDETIKALTLKLNKLEKVETEIISLKKRNKDLNSRLSKALRENALFRDKLSVYEKT